MAPHSFLAVSRPSRPTYVQVSKDRRRSFSQMEESAPGDGALCCPRHATRRALQARQHARCASSPARAKVADRGIVAVTLIAILALLFVPAARQPLPATRRSGCIEAAVAGRVGAEPIVGCGQEAETNCTHAAEFDGPARAKRSSTTATRPRRQVLSRPSAGASRARRGARPAPRRPRPRASARRRRRRAVGPLVTIARRPPRSSVSRGSAGDRVDGERGADAEHQVGPLGELLGQRHRALRQQLAEEDDVRFDRARAGARSAPPPPRRRARRPRRSRRRRRSGCS